MKFLTKYFGIFKYLGVFALAFLFSAAIAYYALQMFTKSAGEIVLPELEGKNIIYVLDTLTNMGLNAKLQGIQHHGTLPKYAVIQQDPAPGTTIKKGRDVLISISKGRKESVIPDLRQLTLDQAKILLAKNEFKLDHVSLTPSETTPKNHVIAQYPEPFSTSLKGDVCNLLVSIGPQQAEKVMPDLSGIQVGQAHEIINQYHLTLSSIRSDVDPNLPNGIVLSQTPLSGSHVDASAKIALVINESRKNLQMNPETLSRMVLIEHRLKPGFLKQHIRVETDRLGPMLKLYDELVEPGKTLFLWIPTTKKTHVFVYTNNVLVKAKTINPWKRESITGDRLWESSPLQFYPPTLPALEMN